jgi:hypothetical protein
MTEGVAPVAVHVVLLLGCSNGMKIPDPDEYQAMRVPLPSVTVTAPAPLRPIPVTASQFGVVDMLVTCTWACAGDAANHRTQVASTKTRLHVDGANGGAALGTFYGGNGTTNFMLPNLQGRIPMHAGQGNGLSARVQGALGGIESITPQTTPIPQSPVSPTTAYIGSQGQYATISPFIVLNFLIALQGIFPSRN